MGKYIKLQIVLILLAAGVTGCEKLPEELISNNLITMGRIDPELLIGGWNITKFAYTTDGEKISNNTDIPIAEILQKYDLEWIASTRDMSIDEVIDFLRPQLEIPDPPFIPLKEDEWSDHYREGYVDFLWHIYGDCNSGFWTCRSLFGNLIYLKWHGSTKKYCQNSVDDDIIFAVSNAHSYVIRGNELIIYFTGIEKLNKAQKKEFKILKNHNLVILTKR